MSEFYQFTLILDGVDEQTPNLEDALFEVGCDDALINYKNGTVYLDFDREGKTLEKTIISAITDVESAKLGAKIISVAPEHLVSLSDIAERIAMTRQAVSLLMLGKRGEGDFPKPVLRITNKSPFWRWSDVAVWLYEHDKIVDQSVIESANVVEDINAALELRNKKSFQQRRKILTQLRQKTG